MGAWIEIYESRLDPRGVKSLPVWERGLKYTCPMLKTENAIVAPGMGAWIEITENSNYGLYGIRVAPGMGAWIEIDLE